MAEQGCGGAAGVEQRGAVMLRSLVQRAEDSVGDDPHDLRGTGRRDDERVPIEDDAPLPVAGSSQCDPGQS